MCVLSVCTCVLWLSLSLLVSGSDAVECYSCPHARQEDGCQTTQTCGPNDICMLRVLSNGTSSSYFETKCSSPQVCADAILQYQGTIASLLGGKRRDIAIVAIGDLCLAQCCEEDRCNNGCNQITTAATVITQSTISTTNASLSIITSPTIQTSSAPVPTHSSTSAAVTTQSPISTTKAAAPTITSPTIQTSSGSAHISSTLTAAILIPTKPAAVQTTLPIVVPTSSAKTPIPTVFTMSPTTAHTSTSKTTSTITISPTTSQHITLTCPHGYMTFDDSCYMFAKLEMNIHRAEEFCTQYDAYLVHIDTAKENNFIVEYLKHLHRGPVQFWIGINDDITENDWRFSGTGGVATYFNWAANEPDNKHTLDGNGDTANCAVIAPHLNYHWTDQGCSLYETAQPICEKRNPGLP